MKNETNMTWEEYREVNRQDYEEGRIELEKQGYQSLSIHPSEVKEGDVIFTDVDRFMRVAEDTHKQGFGDGEQEYFCWALYLRCHYGEQYFSTRYIEDEKANRVGVLRHPNFKVDLNEDDYTKLSWK